MLLGSFFTKFGKSEVAVPVLGGSGVAIPGIGDFVLPGPVFGGSGVSFLYLVLLESLRL